MQYVLQLYPKPSHQYKQERHQSLEDALSDWSLVPLDQSDKYFQLGWIQTHFNIPLWNILS